MTANDGDTKAAIERVRWVVVRAVNGWHDQPQAEYEAAVDALDLITTTLSEQAQPVEVRMVDGRIVLPDVLPRTVAVSDAWLRDVVERLNTLSEQEAELAEVHRRIEDRADSYDLAYPEIAAEFRWCSALTQDSPEEGS